MMQRMKESLTLRFLILFLGSFFFMFPSPLESHRRIIKGGWTIFQISILHPEKEILHSFSHQVSQKPGYILSVMKFTGGHRYRKRHFLHVPSEFTVPGSV